MKISEAKNYIGKTAYVVLCGNGNPYEIKKETQLRLAFGLDKLQINATPLLGFDTVDGENVRYLTFSGLNYWLCYEWDDVCWSEEEAEERVRKLLLPMLEFAEECVKDGLKCNFEYIRADTCVEE